MASGEEGGYMRVAIGLSGGVDSAVAAHLLLQAGHEVTGVTSLNYPESRCCDARAVLGAQQLARQLGIPFHTVDVQRPFRQQVVEPYVAGYLAGRTPNPCTVCNGEIRFEELFEEAEWRFGAEALATGHYARVSGDEIPRLLRGLDPAKDQSYMLYRLTPRQLRRTLFPLGELTKERTRALAAELGLAAAHTPDSQDVCFVQGDQPGFLRRMAGDRLQPGPIVDEAGQLLGTHAGLAFYTVGQRRGLGIASAQPLYVLRLDVATNRVVVGPRAATRGQRLVAAEVNWIAGAPPDAPFEAEVQIRYRSAATPARVTPTALGFEVELAIPQFALTPGQAAVIYRGDELVGGGVIQGA